MSNLTYTMVNGFRLPDLLPSPETKLTLGKYSRMRLNFLKENRRVMYTNLLTSGKLNQHLQEIQETAQRQVEQIVRQMQESQGLTEELKAQDQMQWVGMMNNIRQAAEETVMKTLIYA